MELRKPPNEDLAHLWTVELVPNVKLFMCLIYIFNEDGSVFVMAFTFQIFSGLMKN